MYNLAGLLGVAGVTVLLALGHVLKRRKGVSLDELKRVEGAAWVVWAAAFVIAAVLELAPAEAPIRVSGRFLKRRLRVFPT
jgi:hypothetical protein